MKQRIKSAIWKRRKQKTPNQNNKKEKESPQNEDSLRGPWDNIKCTNICITGVPEGIENLFENTMMENYLNVVKEIPKFRKHRESRPTPRHITIKRPKAKDKERIFNNVILKSIYLRGLF